MIVLSVIPLLPHINRTERLRPILRVFHGLLAG